MAQKFNVGDSVEVRFIGTVTKVEQESNLDSKTRVEYTVTYRHSKGFSDFAAVGEDSVYPLPTPKEDSDEKNLQG